jgi:hypothetical protein
MWFGKYASRAGEAKYPSLWRGLVGAWSPGITGPTGVRAFDLSGRNNHGTATNVSVPTFWNRSQGRYSVSFPFANDQRIEIPSDAGQLNLPERSLSVACWCRPEAAGSAVGRDMIGKYLQPTNPFISYGLEYGSFNTFSFSLGLASTGFVRLTSPASYATNSWYHVCGTYDGSSTRLFINGALVAAESRSQSVVYNTQPLAIGRWLGNAFVDEGFVGKIDDACIYSRALSPSEIRRLASRPGILFERREPQYARAAATFRRRQYSQLVGGGVL